MSRPIKFMVLNEERNELEMVGAIDWVEGQGGGEENIMLLSCNTATTKIYAQPDKPLKLFEFIGLLDKDGKEIYEGSRCEKKNHKGFIEVATVEYQGSCFWPFREGKQEEWAYFETPCEWFEGCKNIGHIAEDEQ